MGLPYGLRCPMPDASHPFLLIYATAQAKSLSNRSTGPWASLCNQTDGWNQSGRKGKLNIFLMAMLEGVILKSHALSLHPGNGWGRKAYLFGAGSI